MQGLIFSAELVVVAVIALPTLLRQWHTVFAYDGIGRNASADCASARAAPVPTGP